MIYRILKFIPKAIRNCVTWIMLNKNRKLTNIEIQRRIFWTMLTCLGVYRLQWNKSCQKKMLSIYTSQRNNIRLFTNGADYLQKKGLDLPKAEYRRVQLYKFKNDSRFWITFNVFIGHSVWHSNFRKFQMHSQNNIFWLKSSKKFISILAR